MISLAYVQQIRQTREQMYAFIVLVNLLYLQQ